MTTRFLVFGASGAVGRAVAKAGVDRGWHVTGVGRRERPVDSSCAEWRRADPLEAHLSVSLAGCAPFDAICWAQGANLNDSVEDFDVERHLALYRANCLSVVAGMAQLVEAGLLAAGGARLVAVSSIWQTRARAGKLSYAVTKGALGALVRAASVDLGGAGHLVNAVLPGVLDTPMTAANLTPAQIEAARGRAPVGRLPDPETVAATVCFLCSPENQGISGQSITVDLGAGNAVLL